MKIIGAFAGGNLIARGELAEVVARCKAQLDAGEEARIALFDDESGAIVDIDFSGSEAEVLARLPGSDSGAPSVSKRRGPGRPSLGVVSREVSLLPRHWLWLSQQRVGASAALRRLVEVARKSESHEAVGRRAIDAAHRFMWDIAGDRPGFEEASRALFASDFERFEALISDWPEGIRGQLGRHIERARAGEGAT